ncbi:acyl-CoA dehydrogenase C-terminal domain-containing protein [Lacimicrobium alkaliphilum]|uniref:3-methylmercaptopropionyl-CoA dehydrogenase n=1 Tax=Lacimicrobium alkaliphilum TaxID=1526571 RepID=A0A0U3B8I5_9ALTE|nr:acyl-CoA dehydrogenase C-terminal domain-containing protein [Lacimicrobium alkaliphilum]ALS99865.1 acyl-CoA dehydrogenase [Lacimicrobium alkaliphilum]
MPAYKAPLRDIRFVMEDLLGFSEHYKGLNINTEIDDETQTAIIEEAAKFSENVISPLNVIGDQAGCQWSSDGVTTPPGYKEAYQQYCAGGWPALAMPEPYGGQGLPESLNIVVSELICSSCVAWSGYAGLREGAIKTLMSHGNDKLKEQFLPNLVSGQWTGTMCLTESHCGSDLGQLKTKATPVCGNEYRLTGTKIFISCGEHDMAENIVHIVLARLPDAPSGTKGISLFVVPKFLVNENQSLGERNKVNCGSIEHKMGVHGFVTCVMNFDGATGYLIGEPNKGLQAMFTFMNSARLTTALQGLVHSEVAYQGAVPYAKERLAMRSLSGAKNPDGPADPIIVHPDVRRMLLTIKSFAEGFRAFAYYVAQQLDVSEHGKTEEARIQAGQFLALLTPVCKGFMTELGCEAAHHGVQIFGGHGYISEWGMEQNQRDSRISTLYEGTTGIQALDLIGRKVLGSKGVLLKNFSTIIFDFCESQKTNNGMQEFIQPLQEATTQWLKLAELIGHSAAQDPEELGAASVDFLMLSGYTILAYFWARMALVSLEKLDSGATDTGLYLSKINTARFYFQRILPRTETLKLTIQSGAESLMGIPPEQF